MSRPRYAKGKDAVWIGHELAGWAQSWLDWAQSPSRRFGEDRFFAEASGNQTKPNQTNPNQTTLYRLSYCGISYFD